VLQVNEALEGLSSLLADAGVLKGSNDAIAQEVNLADVPPRSFALHGHGQAPALCGP